MAFDVLLTFTLLQLKTRRKIKVPMRKKGAVCSSAVDRQTDSQVLLAIVLSLAKE